MSDQIDTDAGRAPAREPSLADAIIPLVVLAVFIASALALFGLDALDGPIQVGLVLSAMVAALIAVKNGNPWSRVQTAAQGAMASVTSATFILLAVGALIGVWNLSGTIPTLVYYGIQILSPSWYYAASAIICGVIALSIGSSWTTAGTIGVGLVGIAAMLGVSPAITAGAVISGAYLGDKASPLSETTILTAQMVKVDVYQHIKRQIWTSIPAFAIALAAFFVIGFVRGPDVHAPLSEAVELASLNQVYNITIWNLLPLVLLAILSIRKVPASLALTFSTLFAGVLGAFLQPDVYRDFVHHVDPESAYRAVLGPIKAVWLAMANGFSIDTGIGDIDRLLARGGMDSMLLTLWLIFGAVTLGALLEEFGLINRLVNPMISAAKGTGRLFLTVFACASGLNIVAGDQYIALVLPSRIFRAEFAKRGLAPTNLSRLAADSGTVTSPLVPWNSCGAFMGAVLGVSTLLYAPYAIFCWASPVLSVLYGFTGFKIEHVPPSPAEDPPAPDEQAS
ncbi:Na+/H+ antiporter NhaC [Kribbella sp. NPDC050820]|uniref:Na+/H+ antiporter NhaC n=1 Tax=Kribbella sp. NPDC050820 TaxID=3155408 RepID=UPI0033CC34F9